jgi:hypothetical protein
LQPFKEMMQLRAKIGERGFRGGALFGKGGVAEFFRGDAIGVNECGEEHPCEEGDLETHTFPIRDERDFQLWNGRLAAGKCDLGDGFRQAGPQARSVCRLVVAECIRQPGVVSCDTEGEYLAEMAAECFGSVLSAKCRVINAPGRVLVFRGIRIRGFAEVTLKVIGSLSKVMPQPQQFAPLGGAERRGEIAGSAGDVGGVGVEGFPGGLGLAGQGVGVDGGAGGGVRGLIGHGCRTLTSS